MNADFNDSHTYSVVFARRATINERWNDIVWNRNHSQIQYHRLYYPLSGRASVLMKNGELELVPGNIYFLPAFSILSSHITGEMVKYYVHFQVDSKIFEMYQYISNTFSIKADSLTEGLFQTLVDSYADSSLSARLRVQGAMNLIMSGFVDNKKISKINLHRFSPVLEYIDENYKQNIPLSVLAGIMNISTMYFSNSFKSVFNISPKQYILNKRLTEGQRLLLETDMSVKEIAYEVGFENENYFSEYFSSKVGISALKFRNKQLPLTSADF